MEESNSFDFEVTEAWLEQFCSASGSWTAAQLRQLGVDWPPPSGWKLAVTGIWLTQAKRAAFEQGRVQEVRKRKSKQVETASPCPPEASDKLFRVTAEWIDLYRTAAGGWTLKQLKQLGVDWPPRKGWKNRVIGLPLTEEEKKTFEQISRSSRPADQAELKATEPSRA